MTPASAKKAVFAALAAGIAPIRQVLPSVWTQENLVVPDGPRAGEKWDPLLTPYLVEPLDNMAEGSGENLTVVRKSAQIGYTMVGQGYLGYVVDVAPAKTLMVLPTIPVAKDFVAEKLDPVIEATPALRAKVRQQVSRSSKGSTTRTKRFPGGSITITGANSTADLRSKTSKNAFGDEIEEWPADLGKQGDPLGMLEARQIAFLRSKTWKRLLGSTPVFKGGRIDTLFEGGDQRYWMVPCPHCGERQRLTFFKDEEGLGGFQYSEQYPHNAVYICRHCGVEIEHWQKEEMVLAGRWIPTKPGPGRWRSYHIDTMISLLVSWDDIVAKYLECKDDPAKLKTFTNLWLGLGWEERGDAPDWQRLYGRREEYALGVILPGGLVLTCSCDVQKRGIYYEVVAWGPGMVSWVVDCGYLEGEPADEDNDVWRRLDDVYRRQYEDSRGNVQGIEAFAVDAGYVSNQVYQWVRTRARAYAIKGKDGWYTPPIGAPSKVDVTLKGRKLRRGAQLWPVGTWSLKAEFYAHLRKDGRRDGAEVDPPGYCHFGMFQDERYFRQITAEYLTEKEVKGRLVQLWDQTGENHYLDCRIYNMAMAAHLRLSILRPDQWEALAALRRVPKADTADLVELMKQTVVPASPALASAAPTQTEEPANAVRGPSVKIIGPGGSAAGKSISSRLA